MKIASLSVSFILLLCACAGSGDENERQVSLDKETKAVQQIVEEPEQAVESSLEAIQSLFGKIDRDIRAKRYQLRETSWQVDPISTIQVKEYTVKGKSQRVKLVYETNVLSRPHPLLSDTDSLIGVHKTYYYKNNQVCFIHEILDATKDSLTKTRIDNRFFFENGNMIRWAKDGEEMDQKDGMYKYYQTLLVDKTYLDLSYAYDYAKDFTPNTDPILAQNRARLIQTYKEMLHWKYPESDTVQVIYEGNLMTNVALLEVLADSASNDPSMLLRLHLKENAKDRYWEGEESLIGRAYQHRAQIKTPGDFYYTMMKIVEMEELDKLRTMIPTQGVYSHATAIVGDIDKPKYDEGITIMRDSIEIEDVSAWFNSDVFRFDVHIDDTFDDKGWGTITWYGGGFMEEIKTQKSGGDLYLMEHRSMDH